MMRQPVQSSRIAAVGYDRDKGKMEVEFTDGAVFLYYNVPREVYVNLLTAASIGRYFNQHVAAAYDYEKVSS